MCGIYLSTRPCVCMQARSRVHVHEGQALGCQHAGLSQFGVVQHLPTLGTLITILRVSATTPSGCPFPICVPSLIPGP